MREKLIALAKQVRGLIGELENALTVEPDFWQPLRPEFTQIEKATYKISQQAGNSKVIKDGDVPDRIAELEKAGTRLEEMLKIVNSGSDEDPDAALIVALRKEFPAEPVVARRYAEIAELVSQATPAQRRRAAASDLTLKRAAAALSPGSHGVGAHDFPLLVKALRPRMPAKNPPVDADQADTAIRAVHAAWMRDNHAVVADSYVILRGELFDAAQKKYAPVVYGAGKVNGFTEEGVIYLRGESAAATTVVHEGLHLYSHNRFKETLGALLDEGVTEAFALEVTEALKVGRKDFYETELAAARVLLEKFTKARVADFYFYGDVNPLKTRFLDLTTAGDKLRAWEDFTALCRAKRFPDALTLL